VHLLRHGETSENALRIIQGQLDTDLNATGRQQAQIAAQAMKNIPFTHAFTSDARRASDTAQAILRYHPGVILKPTALLRERHMGNFQGMVYKKGWKPDSSIESRESLLGRLMLWWGTEIESLLSWNPDLDTPAVVLVVSHGASLRTLIWDGLAHNGYTPPDMTDIPRLYNTSVTSVELLPDKVVGTFYGTVLRYGDISHILDSEKLVEENVDEIGERTGEASQTATL